MLMMTTRVVDEGAGDDDDGDLDDDEGDDDDDVGDDDDGDVDDESDMMMMMTMMRVF